MEKNWKYYLGLSLLAFSVIPLLTVELVVFLPLTNAQAVCVGGVYLASGEGAFLLAAALLGKPFIQSVKAKVKAFFSRLKSTPASKPVGKARHYFGIALFLASFSPYLVAEIVLLFSNPDETAQRILLMVLLAGDLLCIVSLLVLGDDFWERLQNLFRWPGIPAK